jgi:hypothetical protein
MNPRSEENPHGDQLAPSPMARDTFQQLEAAVSHLRSRKSAIFLAQAKEEIEDIDGTPLGEDILKGASELCRLNWALVLPYFHTLKNLPRNRDMISPWTRLTRQLAGLDIDVAVTFVEKTPVALEHRGAEGLLQWGQLALETLKQADTRAEIWKAVKAYLEEAGACQCGYPLSRWQFFLQQAVRIAELSAGAAEAFIQLGNRMCLLLTDDETARWVDDGLDTCRSESEQINFFSGTSLKALESRDGLATGVVLKDRSQTLALICEAALGHPVKILSNTALVSHKGFTGGAATDGHTIFYRTRYRPSSS